MAAGEEKRVRRKAPVAQAPLSSGKPDGDAVGSTLLPRRLEDFIGQEQLRNNLDIFIKAALSRKEPLDHCLLYGPPGLGKTTLAQIIAVELDVRFKYTSGPALTRAGDLASILVSVSYTHLRAHETRHDLVCRLLLEKKKKTSAIK